MRITVVEPSYLRVDHGGQKLKLTVTKRSNRRQLVRVWAAQHMSKMSMIPEFIRFELEPIDNQPLVRNIPAMNTAYWLAVSVFSNDGSQWIRSIPKQIGVLDVPQAELGFVDSDIGGIWETRPCHPDIVLSVVYLELQMPVPL